MILKLMILSIVLLSIAFLGFGVKLLFDKNAKLPAGSCRASNAHDREFSCGCGGDQCANDYEQ